MTAPDVYTFPGYAVLLERPDGSAMVLAAFGAIQDACAYAELERIRWIDTTQTVSVKSAGVRLEVQR